MAILVLGAGIIGLTTAITLRRQGHDVEIWAKAISPGTTSDVAAAFWYPYAAMPVDAVTRWASISFDDFADQSLIRESGIKSSTVSKFFETTVEPPAWRAAVKDYEEFEVSDKPGYLSGFRFSTWIIDMSRYMPYLKTLWKELGGRVAFKPVESFNDIPETYSIIINCTGIGARTLVKDDSLVPARGRVVMMAPFENQPDNILIDAGDALFGMIVPRTHDIVLGGTYEENEDDRSIDDKAIKAIIARCAKLCPPLAHKKREVLGSACGVRPVRSTVRLEAEKISDNRTIIHNYGHGGAGVTLAWGCAGDVAEILANL